MSRSDGRGDTGRLSVLAITGSVRKGSFNTGLMRAAQEAAPEGLEMRIFSLDDAPLYNGDFEARAIRRRSRRLPLPDRGRRRAEWRADDQRGRCQDHGGWAAPHPRPQRTDPCRHAAVAGCARDMIEGEARRRRFQEVPPQ